MSRFSSHDINTQDYETCQIIRKAAIEMEKLMEYWCVES